jgi:3-oxoacyl-[acyl-carrier-protein] synthase III
MTVDLRLSTGDGTAGLSVLAGSQSFEQAAPLSPFTIAGWGTVLPDQVVTNDDLAQHLDTSDEWISSRTGIRERRVGRADETTGHLATLAGRRALAEAGLDPADLDAIIVATTTPEQPVPSTAAGVAAALGASAGAFDVNAACAGFVYGLVVAGGLISGGTARRVLLIGADTMSRFVDPTDRETAVLFGDGAGALVLARDDGHNGSRPAGGLLASDLVGDPEGVGLLVVPAGGSAQPASHQTVDDGGHYLQMDGREVFRRAVRSVADSIRRTLDRAGCTPNDVDLFVPHQANARIIDAVLDRVGLDPKRTLQTVDRHGNTSSASVPLALGEVISEPEGLPDGSLVLTSGFGAGLTVGTSLLRWQTSPRAMGR